MVAFGKASSFPAEGPSVAFGPLSPSELQEWLEWSGIKLLSMNIRSPFPSETNSAWPEYVQTAIASYGYSKERLRPTQPSRYQIDIMDEIYNLPPLVKDIQSRRIIQARSLVTPISNRYLYSWNKIAELNHTSKFRVQRMHSNGLNEIVKVLPRGQVDAIRHSLEVHGT